VLLGRGQDVKSEGNTRFQGFVSSSTKSGKDAVARQVVNTVHGKGGRFLRRVDLDDSKPRVAGEEGESDLWESPVFEIADFASVLVKVKQTFRDFSVTSRKAESAAAMAANTSKSTPSVHNGASVASWGRLQQSLGIHAQTKPQGAHSHSSNERQVLPEL
jgi:hypothetical protein